MIPIPLGNNLTRTRFPRVTVGIIIACFIVHVVVHHAMKVSVVLAAPAAMNIERIEGPLLRDYFKIRAREMAAKDPKLSTDDAIEKMFRDMAFRPNTFHEIREDFREAMREGKVVPLDSPEYKEWAEAVEALERARRRNPQYLLGYVPADRSLTTLFTHQFLHGNFWHLFFNMLFLWLAGVNLEDTWGRRYYAVVYFAGGMVAALSHHALNPGSYSPMIGASGAVATLMGAFTFRFHYAKLRFGFFKWTWWVPAWIPLVLWFLREVYHAIIYFGESTGVATWAHIGGFLYGVLAAYILKRSQAEETFIAAELSEQDHKDEVKARKKAEKKSRVERPVELTKGIEARQYGRLDQSAELLTAAIGIVPDDVEAREELARTYMLMHRNADAGRAMGELAAMLIEEGDRDQALHWYNQILRLGLHEGSAGEWSYTIADALRAAGDLAGAAYNYRAFAHARPADPRAPKALFISASILAEKLGDPAGALEVLGHLAASYPGWMDDDVAAARNAAQKAMAR